MMDRAEFNRLLRHWGRVYGPAPAQEWDEDSSMGSGTLTGSLIEFLRVGVVTGPECRFGPRSRLTARGKETKRTLKRMRAHPVADRIDSLCIVLHSVDPLPALVLRAHYCWRGEHQWRRAWVASVSGHRIGRKRYYRELEAARAWMFLALRAKRAA